MEHHSHSIEHHHHDHDERSGHDKHAGHSPAMFKSKFWLSLILTIPTIFFSHTVQQWLNIHVAFPGSDYIPAILGTIIFFYGGWVFIKGSIAELKQRQPGMMTLIAMAISVAFIYSVAVTFGVIDGMDFWWELATLVTIMLLGHWLEMASIANAQGALNELAKLLPDEAEIVQGKMTKLTPVASVKLNDVVLVRPGGQVPVDGEVVEGESNVNEAMLTGESQLVRKQPGSLVIAGSINDSGALKINVTKIGQDTALAGIMKLVAEAQSSKSRTQILADKAAYYLTFIALGAALITFIGWTIVGATSAFILERVVTVLVIACPHALGLAIPLVTAISTTLAAKNGLLVRQRLALESARNIDVVLFDKTGTLTEGNQGVVGIEGTNTEQVLSIAAALESHSEHPIARAIVAHAQTKNVLITDVTKFSSISGRGVRGYVDGVDAYVGGPRLLESLNLSLNKKLQTVATNAAKEGKTVVYVVKEKKVIGLLLLADVIRKESYEVVTQLKSAGRRVAMITGDNDGVAAWVAEELGIDEYFANVLPGDKEKIVQKLQKDGSRVAMVGDGVNDAPALTRANVGLAIGAGTDVAIASAGIVLASNDPRGVEKVFLLSERTYRKMKQNLVWATGYNVVAIPLASGITAAYGFVLSPALGAVLMSVSTIVVALNAQLLRRLKLAR